MNEQRKKKRLRQAQLSESDLVTEWGDGETTRHNLEALRRNCPCAACRDARHGAGSQPADDELAVLSGEAATATAEARSFDLVGRYGLRLNWADGHNHGIYALEQLRTGAYG